MTGRDLDDHVQPLGRFRLPNLLRVWVSTGLYAESPVRIAEPAFRGVASGLLNSAAQVGTAVGIALLVPLTTATGWAVMTGYRIGLLGACALALGGALGSCLLPARVRRSNRAMATSG